MMRAGGWDEGARAEAEAEARHDISVPYELRTKVVCFDPRE